MVCGSATGKFIPSYVVYKTMNLYDNWCEGDPPGTGYSCTKSGWFDMFVFQRWFNTVFLPAVKNDPGKKLLIGDNLASHLNMEVTVACRRENIVCMLPAEHN